MGKMVFRVDANPQIGIGHIMRCLALAQAWKDRGNEAIFITACRSEGVLRRLRDENFEIHVISLPGPEDWPETNNILTSFPGAWVVMDGYQFTEDYQKQIKQAGHPLLVIDDMAHLKHYYADILLNQNFGAERLKYSCEPYTRVLSGTHYILLRKEFLAYKDWERKIPPVAKNVLVTLGGGDPENYTLKVIRALLQVSVPGLETTVVVGATNPNVEILKGAAKPPIQLVIDADNMPELMARADIAVSGGGSTCWEMAFMGLPNIILVLSDNQVAIAMELTAAGISKSVSLCGNLDSDTISYELSQLIQSSTIRKEMSRRGRQLADGYGVKRIVEIITGEKGGSPK
jgi:UDP-2,4-diacetamido-2,4,6-trideoxy-beta-L-altropyranose hydrolase